jgi:hypothetical protein
VNFGRVEGVIEMVETADGTRLHLVVTLESGDRFEIVRDELLPPLRPIESVDDLRWHADQWTQETIGVELAEQGWEPIGADETADDGPDELARSPRYAVRLLP